MKRVRMKQQNGMHTGIWVLGLAMVVLSGCGRYSQLVPTTANLYVGDSIQVSVKGGTNTPMQSKNPFVASVNTATGWVQAEHVGTTTIECTTTGTGNTAAVSAYCTINVLPRYAYFAEPLLEWGISRSELIAQLGEPTRVEELTTERCRCWYGDTLRDNTVTVYFLSFDQLETATILSQAFTEEQAHLYIRERYYRDGQWEAGYYINVYEPEALEASDVEVYVGQENGWTVVEYSTPFRLVGCE